MAFLQLVAVCAVALLALSSLPTDGVEILRRVKQSRDTTVVYAFDHTSGTAYRIVMERGFVLRKENLPGRPQSSPHEFARAVSIISADPAAGRVLADGSVAEGGFIVDGPSGHSSDHRYIQVRLLSADRRALRAVVLVDLSVGVVASTRNSFE